MVVPCALFPRRSGLAPPVNQAVARALLPGPTRDRGKNAWATGRISYRQPSFEAG